MTDEPTVSATMKVSNALADWLRTPEGAAEFSRLFAEEFQKEITRNAPRLLGIWPPPKDAT